MNEADNPTFQALSALADGQADAALAAFASAAWRDDPGLRQRWHAYHLIGDVLRSEDLADCRHDADFLSRLRSRLEQEPVVLAPAAVSTPATSGETAQAQPRRGLLRQWATPVAVAAGFMAVVGVLTVTRVPVTPDAIGAPQLAQAVPAPVVPAFSGLVGPVAVVEADARERIESTNPMLIRDARLDQYLAAHKQFGGGSALGMPAGFLRSATFDAPRAAPDSR